MLASPPFVSDWLLRAVIYVGVAIGVLVFNGLAVAYIWAEGVHLGTKDRVEPGESGFYIEPMATTYKWLLGAVLAANIGTLLYLLARKQYQYAVSLLVGAAVPVFFLINVLFIA